MTNKDMGPAHVSRTSNDWSAKFSRTKTVSQVIF